MDEELQSPPPDVRCFGVPRSPHWPAVRAAHLKLHPTCEVCGTTENLEVHHKQPFHLFPALELDPANLMTLCQSQSHNDHLLFGHCLSWSAYNPYAVEDAAGYLARFREVRGRGEVMRTAEEG